MSQCKLESCQNEVKSIEGRRPKEFCSVECRTKFHNSKKLKGTGRGRPKGAKNKLKSVSFENGKLVVTDPNLADSLKTHPVNLDAPPTNKEDKKWDSTSPVFVEHTSEMSLSEVRIKFGHEAVLKSQDVIKYAFDKEPFLVIETHTAYPTKDCPKEGYQRTEYLAAKKVSDDKIRKAWNIYKQSKS